MVSNNIWELLRFSGSKDEIIAKYKQYYIDEYVKQEIFDFKGNKIVFPYSQFEHAFSESSNYKQSGGVHDIPFSEKRARYMPWIKHTLLVDSSKIEYTFEYRTEVRTKKGQSVITRTYTILESRYVVVVDKKKNTYHFITAYIADETYIKKILSRTTLLEKKKSPVLSVTEGDHFPKP